MTAVKCEDVEGATSALLKSGGMGVLMMRGDGGLPAPLL
jgi:hypothetical protein